MADVAHKLAYFQEITGIDDPDLCTDILSAHGWDLELVISSITGADAHRPSSSGSSTITNDVTTSVNQETQDFGPVLLHTENNEPPVLAWKMLTLPVSIISGAVEFVTWAAGGILAYSLQMIGLRTPGGKTSLLVSVSQSAAEAMDFVLGFKRVYWRKRPNFVEEGFWKPEQEQGAAGRAALEADQAQQRQRKEEQERLEREAAEAERKRKEEEEARQAKALSLGAEPENGPDVTQVVVYLPSGERKERRFHCDATIQSIYDYVDSLGCLEFEYVYSLGRLEFKTYDLVSNFPRTFHRRIKRSLSLQEAGLHPQAVFFVEMRL